MVKFTGFLITFVSKPVISGFTSAAAITIASSQLKGLFGIKIHSHGLVDTWIQVYKHIGETRWEDLTLGVCSIIVLLFLKVCSIIIFFIMDLIQFHILKYIREFEQFKKQDNDTGGEKALKFFIFLISVGRNAIVVVIATIIAFVLQDNQPFTITGMKLIFLF